MATVPDAGTLKQPIDAVRAMLAVFDSNQLERLEEVVTDDIVLKFGYETYRGIDELRAWMERVNASLPGVVHTIVNYVNDEPRQQASVEMIVTATHSGGFPGGGDVGEVIGTGQHVEWTAGSFGRVRDGKVYQFTAYCDQLVVMKQLGADLEQVYSAI